MKEINYRIQRRNNLNKVFVRDIVGAGNGRHEYCIADNDGNELLTLKYQQGARFTEGAVSGILDQDLLEIVRHRLQCFQEGDYRTRENACALTKLEEVLMWMAKRADDRDERGVLGTMNK